MARSKSTKTLALSTKRPRESLKAKKEETVTLKKTKKIKTKTATAAAAAAPPPPPAAEGEEEPKKKRRYKSWVYAIRNIRRQQKEVHIPGIHAGRRRIFRTFLQEAEAEIRRNPFTGVRYKKSAQVVVDQSAADIVIQHLKLAYKFTLSREERTMTRDDIHRAIETFLDFSPGWDTVLSDVKQFEAMASL